jgi:hypothetical protein
MQLQIGKLKVNGCLAQKSGQLMAMALGWAERLKLSLEFGALGS